VCRASRSGASRGSASRSNCFHASRSSRGWQTLVDPPTETSKAVNGVPFVGSNPAATATATLSDGTLLDRPATN